MTDKKDILNKIAFSLMGVYFFCEKELDDHDREVIEECGKIIRRLAHNVK